MTARVVAQDLRVDGPLGPAVDGLTLEAEATRVVIAGATPELAEALAGVRPVARGRLEVLGRAPRAAREEGLVALAARGALPDALTVGEAVTYAARLAGRRSEAAERSAEAALARLRLVGERSTRVAKLPPLARRAAEVACALATGATCLVLDDPLGDLDDADRERFEPLLIDAVGGEAWILVAREARETSAFVARAGDVVLVEASGVAWRGAPTDLPLAGRWVLRVLFDVEAVARRLGAHGIDAEASEGRVLLTLADAVDADRVVAACVELGAPLLELRPLLRGAASAVSAVPAASAAPGAPPRLPPPATPPRASFSPEQP